MSLGDTIAFDRGETQELPFVVEDDSGPIDITGANIEWTLSYDDSIYLSLSDPTVSITNRNNSAGEFRIRLEADATAQLTPQTYDETITITEANGDVTKEDGRIRIEEV